MNDTLIQYTLQKYKQNDSPHLLDAYLLAAEQANWSGKEPIKKEQLLQEAMLVAKNKNDTAKVHSICDVLISLYRNEEDLYKTEYLLQDIKKYTSNTPEFSYMEHINQARMFMRLEMPDSAAVYAKKGMELARDLDLLQEYMIARVYVDALIRIDKGDMALKVLQDIEKRRDVLPVDGGIYFSYINTWINLGQLDSARAYINQFKTFLKQNEEYDNIIEYNLTEILLGIYEVVIHAKENTLPHSWLSQYSLVQPTNKLVDNSRLAVANSIEQYREQDKLKEEKLLLSFEHEKLKQRSLWAGIILLLVMIILVFVYQRRLLFKERLIQRSKDQLYLAKIQLSNNEVVINENEKMIGSLSLQIDKNEEYRYESSVLVKENEALKKKNEVLQNDIKRYSSLISHKDENSMAYEKILTQNKLLSERESLFINQMIDQIPILNSLNKNPRFITKEEWIEIIQVMNKLFNHFLVHIETDFPNLTEEDRNYCCLFRLGFSTSLIGEFMGISPSSVTKRKQRIKEKMHQQHPGKISKELSLEIHLRSL